MIINGMSLLVLPIQCQEVKILHLHVFCLLLIVQVIVLIYSFTLLHLYSFYAHIYPTIISFSFNIYKIFYAAFCFFQQYIVLLKRKSVLKMKLMTMHRCLMGLLQIYFFVLPACSIYADTILLAWGLVQPLPSSGSHPCD